ncbi:MAG TPA: hypothetical protein VE053_06705 [Allosphingosinicella sp.]|nr:hypothetical protein [Allosphingosinicella sp.]
MFTIAAEPTAWIDISWDGLDEEGFEQKNEIRMKVVFLPLSEMTEMVEGRSNERTIDFTKRVGRDWSQIRGPDQKPFPFTAENLEAVVENVPGFALGFQISYREAWQGKGKVREKNSPAPLADGPAAEEAEKTAPPLSNS